MTEFLALSRSPVPVTLCGETFYLPWRPAAEWAMVMDRYTMMAVLLAEQRDRDRIAELMLEQAGGWAEIEAESYRLIAEQTGRRWWEGLRLISTSNSTEGLGHLTLAGVDPWKVSLGQWCAATYALYTKNLDRQGRLRFDFSLSIPPEGFEDEWDDGSDDVEEIAAAVAGMMG